MRDRVRCGMMERSLVPFIGAGGEVSGRRKASKLAANCSLMSVFMEGNQGDRAGY
jgi:hypothetical protein